MIFPSKNHPLGSHQFKFNLPRWLFVGRFEDKWCCRSMVFTSGILRFFPRTWKEPTRETLGHDNVRQQHVGVEQFEDVFSGRCCYKTSLISSTGVLECWNAFRKDQLFTGKRKTEWQKTKPIFISITFVCQVSTCILCLDYMIMILLACEENTFASRVTSYTSDFAGCWHFPDFHPVARVI